MRGFDEHSGSLFSYVDLETRVPKEHARQSQRQLPLEFTKHTDVILGRGHGHIERESGWLADQRTIPPQVGTKCD